VNHCIVGLLYFCSSEYARDTGEHLFDADDFFFEVADARVGKPVNARGATLSGDSGFRFEPALPQHPLQRGIERAFFHLKQIVGNPFDVFYECIAMHRFRPEGVENHNFQRAGEKIAMFEIICHEINSILKIPIL
jgi:hypothetical protein